MDEKNKNIGSSPFEISPIDKISDPAINALKGSQKEILEMYMLEFGAEKALSIARSMTPENTALYFEFFQARQEQKLAIARWNHIAKSIKYSAASLVLTILTGYGIGYMLHGTALDPFKILSTYIGKRWIQAGYLAFFLGTCHNVYDSILLARTVKKVKEFGHKWLSKFKKKKAASSQKNTPS